MGTQRRRPFRGRKDNTDRLFRPRRLRIDTRLTPPQVHDGVAPQRDTDGRPDFAALAKIPFKLLPHQLKLRVACAVNFHRCSLLLHLDYLAQDALCSTLWSRFWKEALRYVWFDLLSHPLFSRAATGCGGGFVELQRLADDHPVIPCGGCHRVIPVAHIFEHPLRITLAGIPVPAAGSTHGDKEVTGRDATVGHL